MTRFCPRCGTEVDGSALFCPSCGQPIEPAVEEQPAETTPPTIDPGDARTEAHPHEPASEETPPTPPPAPAPQAEPSPASQINVPVTWSVMMSGWLIGGGAAIAALGALIGLFGGFLNVIDLILLLALLGIAATVFFSASIPAIPHLRLVTLVVVLIGFGIALDRIGFGRAGIGTLLVFLGTAAAGIGAILVELGRDQPLGGPGT